MARKHLLSDLVEPKLTAVNSSVANQAEPLQAFNGRGVVGAMSRSLEQLSAEVEAARSVTQALANGEAVIEISADRIDESFVTDRFVVDGGVGDLVASIRAHGQQVPILVRPHPAASGRFQAAYGHRRLKALRELGLPVKCIVRSLDDNALVVAQGQENSARRDLSFVERASFAVLLEDRGFARETIMAALSVDKTELSRMVTTRRALPDQLVQAIGPAPIVGRRRWMDLAEVLREKNALTPALKLLTSAAFAGLATDDRFTAIFGAVSNMKKSSNATEWLNPDGRRVATIRETASTFKVAIDSKAAPDFGQYLLEELPSLYARYMAQRVPGNTN